MFESVVIWLCAVNTVLTIWCIVEVIHGVRRESSEVIRIVKELDKQRKASK